MYVCLCITGAAGGVPEEWMGDPQLRALQHSGTRRRIRGPAIPIQGKNKTVLLFYTFINLVNTQMRV